MKISLSKIKKATALTAFMLANSVHITNAVEYPDEILGTSAKPGFYMMDLLVNNLGVARPYNNILSDVTGALKTIAVNQRSLGNPEDFQTQEASFAKLAICEEAFNDAAVYQTDDTATYEKIKRYVQVYTTAEPYARGTALVNTVLFDGLCLHHNIFPRLMDGSVLKRPLFKRRHVVASTPEIADRISVYLGETFDPATRDTPLCEIMKRHGSDKSTVHNYTKMYNFLFESKRETAQNVFEMGIGSIDPSFAYTMGANGTVGASFRGHREYFPNAQIFGADIDKKTIDTFNELGEARIKTYYADQLDPTTVNAMFDQTGVSGFDIIIDDGLHCFEANHKLFLEGIKRLAPGGIYVIEDIAPRGIPLVLKLLEEISYDAAFIRLPTMPALDG